MTIIRNFYRVGFAVALILVLIGSSFAAEAKQTSLNRILEAFEKIDGRTNAHEQDAVSLRASLEQLAREMAEARGQLASLPDDGDPNASKKRRVLQARMTNIAADYLNNAHKLVDSAAVVISENLADILKLAEEIRKSDDPAGESKKLQRRIQENIAAGRSMRGALVQLRNWAQSDPGLVRRFQSLRRITLTLDRGINVDRARLAGNHKDATDGAIRSKRQEALDSAVNRLGDMYAEVLAEKEVLLALRDDVAVAVALGRLQLTQEVAERAIPSLGSPKAPSKGLDSLADMATALGELNDSIFDETKLPEVRAAAMPGQSRPAGLAIDGFNNF